MDRESLIDVLRGRDPSSRTGAFSIARSLLGRVASTVRAVLPVPPERRLERPPPATARREDEPVLPVATMTRLADAKFAGVTLDEGETLAVVWRVRESAIARAQLIAPSGAEIHLRVVRVSWPEDAEAPRVERVDHGVVRSEGTIVLAPRAPGEKIVVAIGLAKGDSEIVAIDHATLG
ncbi:hypothetical protein [Sandaracinus amylolyticus]|uniref:Uncharacterized protein n=1 Tax=Sandaracinus amylolyticus TaxID=927083 RepID=A0A0F6YGV9_9BACT|nr:hypothetical protein [Sandaracinus amylolyticus]AKF03301.1 hypothetical protein DB32_000450 [Sandaracinus amylolyticus]